MSGRPEDSTPEAINREQQDEGQANEVADDARSGAGGLSESRHGGHTNPAQILPDDVPDLVDKMNEMIRSGHIDNDAFAGEPSHDDEEDILGETESVEYDELESLLDDSADLLGDAIIPDDSYGDEDR